MGFDGVFTHFMVCELTEKLQNGRVTKISQPYPNEIILTIRANRKNQALLLSANSNYARVQITQLPYTNPAVPSNFTMMLRKYLEGSKLIKIEQLTNDRVINFSFLKRDELGDALPLLLSVEIMGRHSNIILIDQKEQKIIDCIKHIGPDQNRYRLFLPNATYRQPPLQDKQNPFTKLDCNLAKELTVSQLVNVYQGLDKNSATLLLQYLNANQAASFFTFKNQAYIYQLADTLNYSVAKPLTGQIKQEFNSLSACLDVYYQAKATTDRVNQQGSKLIQVIQNNLKRNRNKLKKLQQELTQTKQADTLRIKGELLTTYLYQIQRGMSEITIENYYDEQKPLTIVLDKQLSPSQNAQRYFKKYQKLKNAVGHLTTQIDLTQTEIQYFEGLQTQLNLAEPKDLPDIKMELQNGGYLKENSKQNKGKRPKISQPEIYTSTDGTKISVGKNNLQNDQLTLKIAKKSDIWLHAKNIAGSHVIIHSATPSQTTLLEAANLAAYYSKSRLSANVAVDYVTVNKIRKPNGAKPGFVIYEGQKTLYVTPDEKLITQLALNQE